MRKACLHAVRADGENLYFTSSGTEADNLAILGFLRTLRGGGKVLVFQLEHPAVLSCMPEIKRMGFQVEEMVPDSRGVLSIEKLKCQLTADVRLICLMQVHNESGAIQPIKDVAALRDALCPNAAIHVDGVQGFLRCPIDFQKLGIQSYAFSGHKIHALKGIGGLIVRKDHRVNPIMLGGGQESGIRSGTENTAGIAAIGAAVSAWQEEWSGQMMQLKCKLWRGIHEHIPEATLNGPDMDDTACAPHILNVSLNPVRSETMLNALAGAGIMVSAGSACSSHKQKVSSGLISMGVERSQAESAIRFSLCPETTEDEIETVIEQVVKQWTLLHSYVRR